jgi:hypothetical protein
MGGKSNNSLILWVNLKVIIKIIKYFGYAMGLILVLIVLLEHFTTIETFTAEDFFDLLFYPNYNRSNITDFPFLMLIWLIIGWMTYSVDNIFSANYILIQIDNRISELENKNIKNDNGINEVYYKNGKGVLKERFYKKNGKLNGLNKRYFESGQLQQEESYYTGMLTSTFKYSNSGEVTSYSIYKKNGELFVENKSEEVINKDEITRAKAALSMIESGELESEINAVAKSYVEKKRI